MASLEEQLAALQYPSTEFNVFGKVMGGLTTAGAGYVAVDSLIKSNQAKKEAKKQQGYVDTLMSQYMSKPIYNPYQNLSVATQAAEIKQQETDQALANTLDTIRELGYGAGGATALARAAQKSKLGIAADIEKQEVANEQLKGKGEMIVQQAEFSRLGQQMDYEQSKADQARAEQFGYAERGMDAIAGLGSIGLAMGRGLTKPKSQDQTQDNKENTIQDPNTDFYGRINNPDPSLGLNLPKPDLLPTDLPVSLAPASPSLVAPKIDPTKPTGYTGPQYGKTPTDKLDQILALQGTDMGKNMTTEELYLSIGLDPRAYGIVSPSTLYSPQYMDELQSNYFYSPLGGGAGQIETDTP